MKKIWNFLKEVEWKKEFTTWSGFVGRAWNWIWGIYMLFLAGINFYLAVVEHPAYGSVAIWQLFAVFMWFLFHSMIRHQKEMRGLHQELHSSRNAYIEALQDQVRAQDAYIKKLKEERSNATGTQA